MDSVDPFPGTYRSGGHTRRAYQGAHGPISGATNLLNRGSTYSRLPPTPILRRPSPRPFIPLPVSSRARAYPPCFASHSLRPPHLSDCSRALPGYPYYTPLALNAYSLHVHLFTLIHRTPCIPHRLRFHTDRPRPVTYFRPVLPTPVFTLPPRCPYSPRRLLWTLRAPRCRVCAHVFH